MEPSYTALHCRPQVGNYLLPNSTESWEPCTRDPSYVDGCKIIDRAEAEGKGKDSGLFISPTSEDNVLIGDYLEYVCPENPQIPGQFMVASWNATFKVKCVADGQFQEVAKDEWPECVPPGTCVAIDGPEVPESTKGLSNTYTDRLMFQNQTFACTDSIKEPVGPTVLDRGGGAGKVVEVMCGLSAEGTAVWEVPAEWPVCTFKDEFSCDPSTELDVPDWTGLIPENTKFVLYDSMSALKCRDSALIVDLDDGSTGPLYPIFCNAQGDFDMPANSSWPVCRMPTCPLEARPNNTGELLPLSNTTTDVGSFLDFACDGGNVTDDGRTLQLQCLASQEYEVKYKAVEEESGWPACRQPASCEADTASR